MSTPSPASPSEVYAATRDRLIAWFRTFDEATASTGVGACPGWTVRDTVAHVVGIVDDLLAGRTEGLGGDEWTAAQVRARSGRSLAELCDEWTVLAPAVDAFTTADPWFGTRITSDLATHEHDIRTALGRPGERDSPAVHLGLHRYATALGERIAAAGLAPVALVADGATAPGPGAQLHGSAFELLRCLTGRRSAAQVRALRWVGADPVTYLPVISAYGQPAADLVE